MTDNEGILQIDEQGFEDIINESSEDFPEGLRGILEEVNELRETNLDSEPRSVEEICEELGELFNPPRLSPEAEIEAAEQMPTEQPGETSGPAVFEPCAWYAPVHYFGANWGIYIREDCVKSILRTLVRHCIDWKSVKGMSSKDIVLKARTACFLHFYFHEQFHHKIESLGFRALLLSEKDRYMLYKKNVYRPLLPSPNCLEESLANADGYIRFSEDGYIKKLGSGIIKAIRLYSKVEMSLSPSSYKQVLNYLSKKANRGGLHKLQSQFVEANIAPRNIQDWMWPMAPQVTRGANNIKAKIYTVVNRGRPSIFGSSFDPKHTASSKKLCAAISKYYGFVKKRGGKGSHEKYEGDDFKGQRTVLTIPGRRESLSIGVIKHVVEAICGKPDITLIDQVLNGTFQK